MYKQVWTKEQESASSSSSSSCCCTTSTDSAEYPQNGRSGHCSWIHGNKLYIFGGAAPEQTNDLFAYDLASSTWSKPKTSGTAPTPRTGACAAVVGNSAIIFGGNDQECPTMWTNDTYILNMSTMKWSKAGTAATEDNTPPSIRDKASCCSFLSDTSSMNPTDTLLCIFGGFGPINKENTDEKIAKNNENENAIEGDNDDDDDDAKLSFGWFNDVHCFDTVTMKWTKYTPTSTDEDHQPSPRCATVLCPISDKSALIFGGRTSTEGRTNDMWRMTLNTADKTVSWEKLNENESAVQLPPARSFHSACYLKSCGAVVLYGGISAESEVLNDVWMYGVENRTWKRVEPLSGVVKRSFHTACLSGEKSIYVYGGENNFDEEVNACTNYLNDVAVIEINSDK